MTSQGPEGGSSGVRFEATVHPRARGVDVRRVEDLDLDLDRVPDPEGEIRLLVTEQDVQRLVAEGFEVRIQAVHPVRPLDPALVTDDADVHRWFDDTTREAREDR